MIDNLKLAFQFTRFVRVEAHEDQSALVELGLNLDHPIADLSHDGDARDVQFNAIAYSSIGASAKCKWRAL